jgi:oxygen-independent coproporphyrinogen-3 oxidase
LSFSNIEQTYSIDFQQYFSTELQVLKVMQDDALLTLNNQGIEVLAVGRLLIRNICMVFDAYVQANTKQFSKVI